jgi:HrpA-like RNA helicase
MRFKLPLNYDKRWRLNFVYKTKKETFAAYDWQGRAIQTDVTDQQAKEFELILHLYLDFCQKEKFRKLQKLRENQSSLPVYKYRQVVLDTVRQNQVTIIAGDTGCGKVNVFCCCFVT